MSDTLMLALPVPEETSDRYTVWFCGGVLPRNYQHRSVAVQFAF